MPPLACLAHDAALDRLFAGTRGGSVLLVPLGARTTRRDDDRVAGCRACTFLISLRLPHMAGAAPLVSAHCLEAPHRIA